MDYLGEYEPHNTIYTLTVFTPTRSPWVSKYVDCVKFAFRKPENHMNYVSERDHRISPDEKTENAFRPEDLKNYVSEQDHKISPDEKPKNAFGLEDLKNMKRMKIKIQSYRFPPELRCEHVQGKSKNCDEGCYVLEKGGDNQSSWWCKRDDCEGHVFNALEVKKDDKGWKCFGREGDRMVALETDFNVL